MEGPKRKGIPKVLKKGVRIFFCLMVFGALSPSLSCNTGTNSTGSSSAISGTGTNWTISIQIGTNPISIGNTTSIMATVRDRTGAPAPFGTYICTTVVNNGLLKPGETVLYATVCETTSNNLGQTIQTYGTVTATFSGVRGNDTIEVSSQGVIARATITVL
jgi:hypothetical protein